MAVTVTDDFTTIKDMDNATGVTRVGTGDPFGGNPTADTDVQAQGTASVGRVPNVTGVGGFDFDTGAANVDVTDEHILMWIYAAGFIYSEASIRIASGSDAGTNYGEWDIVTPDDALAITEGAWVILAADPIKPFDATAGTPPAITAIRSFAAMVNITVVVDEASKYFVDEYKRGTGITVTGGAATPRGSVEVAANDKTNGRGTFINAKGAFYVMGRVTVGDVTAATNSAFDDTNKTWIWQGLPVSAAWHVIEFVGGTGTNRATFGVSSGTGTAKEGSSGNSFLAGGDIPFRIKALDSDITAEMFGCNLVGPPALYDDAVRNFKREDNSASSFVDDTRDANDPGVTDCELFPTGSAVNDAAYWGHDERISLLKINTGTAGVGTYTVTWEYWNGTTWASLIDVTDGTTNFKTTGLQTVSFAIPDNWAKTTVDTDSRYWIRARRDGGTMTTSPVMSQCFTSMGGWVEWEQTNAESIRTTYTNMDCIRVRNSAKLKKATIVDSVAPATSAAVSFGPTDPAADTCRDLVINGGINGLLLQPSGATTYNLRNIKFSGQSGKKIRIEATAGTAVTINIVDGGDTPTSTDLDLAGGITTGDVTIVSSVSVTVTVLDDSTGSGINLAHVQLYLTSDYTTVVMSGATNASGVITASYSGATPADIEGWAREMDISGTDYEPKDISGTIDANGFAATVRLKPVNY